MSKYTYDVRFKNKTHQLLTHLISLYFPDKDTQIEVDSMYYGNGTSRINNRIPITKRSGSGEEGVGIGNLLEDEADLGDLDESVPGAVGKTQSLLSSLMVDTSKTRTPMDLIQVWQNLLY